MNVRMIRYTGNEGFWDERASRYYTTETLTLGNAWAWFYGNVRDWAVVCRRLMRLRLARRVANWMGNRTRCGRRDDMIFAVTAMNGMPQPPTGSPLDGPDLWIRWPGLLRTCDHCGSLHPADALQAVISGTGELSSTDKNYKVYVQVQERGRIEHYKAYRQHFTEDEWGELFVKARVLKRLDTWCEHYRSHT